MKAILICLILAMNITIVVRAQKKTDDSIAGVWKGTSICQVKPSPCNDEKVVYYITKGKSDSAYTLQANKIVNGVEEDMGSLDFVYDARNKILKSIMKDRQGRPSVWLFRLDGKKIHGTLTINENTLFRVIEVEKNNTPEGNSAFVNDSKGRVMGHE